MSIAEQQVAEAAEAERKKAEALTSAATSEAAAAAVAAAQAGAGLANANAAKAELEAAEEIEENQEELSCLRNQVEAQGKAITEVAERQSQQSNQLASVLAGVEKLTASISAASEKPEAEPVNPEAAHEKDLASKPEASEEATKKTPSQKAAEQQTRLTRHWI